MQTSQNSTLAVLWRHSRCGCHSVLDQQSGCTVTPALYTWACVHCDIRVATHLYSGATPHVPVVPRVERCRSVCIVTPALCQGCSDGTKKTSFFVITVPHFNLVVCIRPHENGPFPLCCQSGHVSARCGVAAALRALAPVMGPDEVPVALDFLIGNGLADMSEKVGLV
eukprot:scaffold49852_cov22-Tisochrysis_lutea.AAC.3